eukprot:scaffold31009_cov48-Phaeocystis_antarctica.AAC.1
MDEVRVYGRRVNGARGWSAARARRVRRVRRVWRVRGWTVRLPERTAPLVGFLPPFRATADPALAHTDGPFRSP